MRYIQRIETLEGKEFYIGKQKIVKNDKEYYLLYKVFQIQLESKDKEILSTTDYSRVLELLQRRLKKLNIKEVY